MSSGRADRFGFGRVVLAGAIAALGGCGGGGGGGGEAAPSQPAATVITAENADAVAARGYETADALFQGVDAATTQLKSPGAPADRVSVVRLSLTALRWTTAEGRTTGTPAVSKAVQNVTEACPGGGSASATANDANGNGILDAGDTAGITFNRCVIEGVTLEGGLSFAVQSYASTPAADSVRAAFTYGNLRATGGGTTSTINGDLTLSATIGNTQPSTADVTLSGNRLDVSDGAETRTLTGYSGRATFDDAARAYTYAVTGAVSGTGLPGTLTLSTPTTIAGRYGADPTSGALLVSGANGSSVRLVAAPPTGVQVSLDADGNGAAESTRTLTWAQLAAL